MAIKSFADETTADIYNGLNTKAARRIPRDQWKSAQRKLTVLHTATTTQDLSLPGLHFEPLKYDRPGFNSIRVSDRYRISCDTRYQRADEPVDERWVGENPKAHYAWHEGEMVPMEEARKRWGV